MEKNLYRLFKEKSKTRIGCNRIENRAISGMPDILCTTICGMYFTLELKEIKSDNSKVNINPSQVMYHTINQHTPSFFLIRKNPLMKSEPPIYRIFHGSRAMELKSKSVNQVEPEIVTNNLSLESLILPLIQLVREHYKQILIS